MDSGRGLDEGGTPETGLAEWTSKIRTLQHLVDSDEAAERGRLELEIAQSREERARRKQRISQIAPSALRNEEGMESKTSVTPAPMSLATFIGGRATGPRLNKPRPQENVHEPTLYDTKPYSHSVSPLAQVARGVGGPARQEPKNRGNTTPGLEAGGRFKLSNVSTYDPPRLVQASSATVNASVAATGPTPAFPVTSRNRLAPEDPKADPTPIEGSWESASLPFSTLPKSSAPSPAVGYTSNSAKSMPTGNSVLRSPFLKGSNASSVFDHEQPSKPLTPSLTRLQGRGFVGERVKASESPLKEAVLSPLPTSPASSSSVANPPPKSTQELMHKRTVLDRWPPEPPSTPFKDNFPEDPPQSSKSFVSTSGSPSSTARYVGDPSTLSSEKTTNSPVSSPSSGKLPTQSITFSKPGTQNSVLPLAIGTTQNPMPLSFNKSQSSTLSSMQVPKGTGEVVQGTIHTQKYDESSHNSQTLGLKTNDSVGLVSTSSTPLNHLTKDRARKPRKGTAPLPTIANLGVSPPIDERPRGGTLSPPPKFNPMRSPSPSTDDLGPSLHKTMSPDSTSGNDSDLASTKDLVNNVTGRWGNQPPIGIKSLSAPKFSDGPRSSRSLLTPSSSSAVGRRALPGMAKSLDGAENQVLDNAIAPVSRTSLPNPTLRRTAMEMAETMGLVDPRKTSALVPSVVFPEESTGNFHAPESSSDGRPSSSPRPRRRLSHDKYSSAITLPPLVEVQTPPPTISRVEGQSITTVMASKNTSIVPSTPSPVPNDVAPTVSIQSGREGSFLKLDVPSILASSPTDSLAFDPSFTPISTDVFSIKNRSATPVPSDPYVFYDTELRTIVYRCKDTRRGLASTTIWTWQGDNAVVGEAEEWKVRDLESRFGTKAIRCIQGNEPADLIGLLGGVVAIRQGTRVHWSIENTSMHCVRSGSSKSSIIIDEVDLDIRNLCSAFSYVVIVLGVIYVWHGRGSLPSEASQAMAYAALMRGDSLSVLEFNEGEEDPMFWMYLGQDEWAKANLWTERPRIQGPRSSRAWKVSAKGSSDDLVGPLPCLSNGNFRHDEVYVLDGVMEIYILVGKDARGQRDDIRLALDLAQGISVNVAHERPFQPTIHVVILPSKLPIDLRVGHVRFLNEDHLNGGLAPAHMNVLPLSEALEHVRPFFFHAIIPFLLPILF
ncbi:hypothetical protein BS47DRAFT_1389287 [Hydnum rufescens UP504]|uniref:Gelsolin repeat protein n=1 Tax=Hydnum rufescens UP504 TaxID=1448309 RepID=A0A9P6DX41_9AGAM|nr:hypothetical protein BS47DRAFT_1389287 [Hydnum rufescens UP504]